MTARSGRPGSCSAPTNTPSRPGPTVSSPGGPTGSASNRVIVTATPDIALMKATTLRRSRDGSSTAAGRRSWRPMSSSRGMGRAPPGPGPTPRAVSSFAASWTLPRSCSPRSPATASPAGWSAPAASRSSWCSTGPMSGPGRYARPRPGWCPGPRSGRSPASCWNRPSRRPGGPTCATCGNRRSLAMARVDPGRVLAMLEERVIPTGQGGPSLLDQVAVGLLEDSSREALDAIASDRDPASRDRRYLALFKAASDSKSRSPPRPARASPRRIAARGGSPVIEGGAPRPDRGWLA